MDEIWTGKSLRLIIVKNAICPNAPSFFVITKEHEGLILRRTSSLTMFRLVLTIFNKRLEKPVIAPMKATAATKVVEMSKVSLPFKS